MKTLEQFHEEVCCANLEEVEYKETPLYEYPISNAMNFIITNSEFIEVRFAKNEDEYIVLIYKIANRERKLCYENIVLSGNKGNPECNSTKIYNVLKEAM